MSAELITVKVEPPDEFSATSNSVSPAISQTGSVADNNETLSSVSGSSSGHNDTRNFTCLLCDVVCDNRDDLRKHLKVAHASKSYGISSAMFAGRFPTDMTNGINLTTYMNYRYTCSLCSAKFKSFRSYLSHTMSHRGVGNYQTAFDEARMATLLGTTGKQYLREYMDHEETYPGTFTCDECKTVFMQRDAYAMHMMTRAMNESCQQPPSPRPSIKALEPEDNISDKQSETHAVSPRIPNPEAETSTGTSSGPIQDRCIEDVTSKVDQDEYLKSVLDKVFIAEGTSKPENNGEIDLSSTAEDRKMCSFCDDTFGDQDSLAMHVMSDHSEEMTHNPNKKRPARAKSSNGYHGYTSAQQIDIVYSCRLCDETFASRDTLAMHVLSHAHRDDIRLGYNPYKRARTETGPSVALADNAKILRTMEHIHKMSFNSNIYSQQTRGGPKLPVNSLYCSVCGVQFYSHTELEWHKRQHFEQVRTSDVQPLCLVKTPEDFEQSGKKSADDSTLKEEVEEDCMPVKQRRNSFSSCEQFGLSSADKEPQRPFSTGDVSLTDTASAKFLEEINIKKTKTELDKKLMTKTSILPAVNALSSNEQRIIYSVFGKDLGLQSSEKAEEFNKQDDLHKTVDDPTESETTKRSSYETAKDETNGNRPRQTNGNKDTPMCKFCEIIFLNKAIYYLHMGLHNVNNPWQCNICGKVCKDAVDFTAHVIHM